MIHGIYRLFETYLVFQIIRSSIQVIKGEESLSVFFYHSTMDFMVFGCADILALGSVLSTREHLPISKRSFDFLFFHQHYSGFYSN